jgi:hypothetical protein
MNAPYVQVKAVTLHDRIPVMPAQVAGGRHHRVDLDRRVAALRHEIAAAERKRCGIDAAIVSRRSALTRLLVQLALCESGGAPSPDA